MKFHVQMAEHFGPRVGDGALALEFLESHVSPFLTEGNIVVMDFTGIRSANSSFVNALFAELVSKHGSASLDRLEFKGCRPTVVVLIESALQLAIERASTEVPKACV